MNANEPGSRAATKCVAIPPSPLPLSRWERECSPLSHRERGRGEGSFTKALRLARKSSRLAKIPRLISSPALKCRAITPSSLRDYDAPTRSRLRHYDAPTSDARHLTARHYLKAGAEREAARTSRAASSPSRGISNALDDGPGRWTRRQKWRGRGPGSARGSVRQARHDAVSSPRAPPTAEGGGRTAVHQRRCRVPGAAR